MPNPYDTSNPADPVRAFAGREDELRRIRSCVESSREGNIKNVFIEGEWGIGKTSLLFKLRPEIQEHGPVVNEVLADRPEPEQTAWFYSAVFSELMEAKPRGVETEDFQGLDFRDQRGVRKLLKAIWDGFHGTYRIVVIMLDELERAEPRFLLSVRDVFQRLAQDGARYMLVFAGRHLPTQGSEAANPVSRFFHPQIVLQPFDEQASFEAIRKPVRGGLFSVNDEAARMIHERADGHPYFLKLICSEVFELSGGRGEIDVSQLERLWPAVEEGLARAKFITEFEKLPDGEQITLLEASRLGRRFEAKQLRPSKKTSLDTFLRRLLKDRELLRSPSRGVYELYHPLFGAYLRAKAEERKLKPTTAIPIPEGRPSYGRDQIEDCINAIARRRLDVLDHHFARRTVTMLEAAGPEARIRVLMGEDKAWPSTLRQLRELDVGLRRRIEVRSWPETEKPIPWHYRCLIGDTAVWTFDHSFDQGGKKKAWLTDDTANRKTHVDDYKRWWKESRTVFPEKPLG